MNRKIKIGGAFEGVGGFPLGLMYAFGSTNVEHKYSIEWDKHCQNVLRYRFPETELHSDVSLVDETKLPYVDIFTYGFPCQDISLAGKQKGILHGERSSLFDEAIRIINATQPRVAIAENVANLTSKRHYESFQYVLNQLSEIGYSATFWITIDSQFFGVPQRRKRIFIFSFRETDRDFAEGFCEQIQTLSKSMCWDIEKGKEQREGDPRAVESKLGKDSRFRTISFPSTGGSMDGCYTEEFSGALKVGSTRGGAPPAVAFQRAELRKHGKLTDYGQGVSPTLQASTKRGDYETNVMEPIGFRLQRFGSGEYTNDETASTLKARDYKDHTDLVAYSPLSHYRYVESDVSATIQCGENKYRGDMHLVQQELYESHPNDSRITGPKEVCPTIAQRWGTGGNNTPLVQRKDDIVIRRLTPVETCRLQGFPDDWNAQGINDKGEVVPISDSQRYRQMGNAVTVNVIEWIGNQLKPLFS